jgi:NNP family nitrate/nitrite transporter-like MFS transporter
MTDAGKPTNAEQPTEQPSTDHFKCKVNENLKATELPLLRLNGTVRENPHMRAFWASTCSFFIAFVGWFALAPVAIDVMYSIGQCENQLYEVGKEMNRPAFVDYKSLATGKPYCVHGKTEDNKDCNKIPTDEDKIPACKEDASSDDCEFAKTTRYDVETLEKVKCVCGKGTECKNIIATAGIASVGSTVFVRVALGTLLERLGPVNVQSSLLVFGGFWVAVSSQIYATWNYYLCRFLIGCAGATFVTNQFWCSMMFAPNVVGTANATAAGWGNLGGGVTQIFIMWCLVIPFRTYLGWDDDRAWRTAMFVPAVMFFVVASLIKLCCWDLPNKKKFDPAGYKITKPSVMDYCVCLSDAKVVVMIIQYGACFGTELAMNNQLATHFRVYFQMPGGQASALAGCFGLMNLFARSLGGISSDILFAKFDFRGRLWAQFLALFGEGFFLFVFACVSNEYQWYHALAALICFSLCVQMAEGTSYGIVPFMKPEQLACVSALVGAGGNAGAVFAGFCFYKQDWDDNWSGDATLTPFKLHAVYVIVTALMNPLYYWPKYGSMFSPPVEGAKEESSGGATPIAKGDATPGTTLVNLTSGGQKVTGAESARV